MENSYPGILNYTCVFHRAWKYRGYVVLKIKLKILFFVELWPHFSVSEIVIHSYCSIRALMKTTLFQGHCSNFCSLFSRIQVLTISKRINGTSACSLGCWKMHYFFTLPSSLHQFLLSKLNAAVDLHINNVLMLTFFLYCFGDPVNSLFNPLNSFPGKG